MDTRGRGRGRGRGQGRGQQSYEKKPSTEEKFSDSPTHSIKMSSSSTSCSSSGNASKGKIISLTNVVGKRKLSMKENTGDFQAPRSITRLPSSTSGSDGGNALKGKTINPKPTLEKKEPSTEEMMPINASDFPAHSTKLLSSSTSGSGIGKTLEENPLDTHKGDDPSNKHTVSAGPGSSNNPNVSAHGLDSYIEPPNKKQKMEKATFMELNGMTVVEAARQTGVPVARFIQEGNADGFFECRRVDRITRLTASEVDVFFTVRYQDREIFLKVPGWATINQFKKMTDFPLGGSYHWKLGDKWLELETPKDWDSCLVWNEVKYNNAEFIEVKVDTEHEK